jgi:predicted molibdopterin-dependent oxidoreductase YjgC
MPTRTLRNAHSQSLELVIIQDLFLNETASAFGLSFLPAASSFEKDGTFMNASVASNACVKW